MHSHYRRFSKSLAYAFYGIKTALHCEPNMRIHLFFGVLAILFGFLLKISEIEWLILMITITLVLFAELMNTALESNVDLVTKTHKAEAKIAKDVAAGAVLIASINAIAIGIIIFGHRLL
jgi:diacylglycerol kinase